MADAAVTFLLENVKQLVVDKCNLISGARDELNLLKGQLDMMKGFLKDAADKKSKGNAFKVWEKQIREVVYKAEDVIDSCLSQAAAETSHGGGGWKRGRNRLDLADEVKKVREQHIEPVFKSAESFLAALPKSDDTNEAQSRNAIDRIRKLESLRDKEIVGFEDSIEELIGNLKETSTELEAISITGMPGLGKTTVASKIFHNSRIHYEFPTRIWVNVSEDYNRHDIYVTILKKFTNSKDACSMSEAELRENVRDYLNQVKFLLVLDDVCTVEAWNDIKCVLPMNKGLGNKVLITSREDTVASNANPRRRLHPLRFLRKEESWKLLQFEVYGKEGVWPLDLKAVGEVIAGECGGLPLALVVTGGILKDKISQDSPESTKSEWTKLSQSVKDYMMEKERSMEKIIALSYDKMPYHLRDCFLYLGMFPERFEISVWKLTRLWIAEGFIQEVRVESSLEETAMENLKELIQRNLVMVGDMNARGEPKTCRVHDMIREFCKKEATEQNFLQEIIMSKTQKILRPPVSEVPNFRRLCIHSHILDFLDQRPKGPHTRSFLCFSKERITMSPEKCSLLLDAFDLLRIFEGTFITFPKFPSNLSQLVHLRYITLAASKHFKALPETISKLWNLQTILIETSSRAFGIKVDMSTMRQLRHLKTKAAITLTKENSGAANRNLQSLSRLSIRSCTDEVLRMFPCLKILGIRGELISLLNRMCLEKLGCLEKLKLFNDCEKTMQPLPWLMSIPPGLKILTLSATNLRWQHMCTLAKLENLEILKLKENAFYGEDWKKAGAGFVSLHFLQIERSDLTIWTLCDGAFPKLRSLVLKNCEKLLAVPPGLAKKLQTLKLERVTRSAVSSAKEIEKEKIKNQAHSMEMGGFKLIIAPADL